MIAGINRNQEDLSAIAAFLPPLLGVQHKVTWTETWAFVDALRKVPEALPANTVIVLGGWHQAPPDGLADGVIPPPDQLILDLFTQDLCVTITSTFNRRFYAMPPDEKKELDRRYDRLRRDYHEDFLKSYPTLSFVDAAAEEERRLMAILRRAFLFMESKAFLFSPKEGDPRRGWDDLFLFALAYNGFPDRSKLGPYYLVIHVP